MHRSLLKRFPLFIWLCLPSLQCLISALTQAGGSGLFFRLLVPLRCGEGPALLSLSKLFRPCAARGSSPRVFHKSAEQKAAPAFCAFPVRAAQAARSLMGTVSLVRRAFSPPRSQPQSPPHRLGACALCLPTTLPADVDHPESQEVFV